MRPDEHKKKKSAQYKKKHNNEKSKTDNKPATRPTEAEKTKDTQHLGEDEPKYSKRQVVQPSQSYDLPEDYDDNDEVDVDVETLIQSAGGADSYMKLAEEKEWENPEELDDMFCINTEELSTSFQHLTLLDKLGISADQLKPESGKDFDFNRNNKDDITENESFISLMSKYVMDVPWSVYAVRDEVSGEADRKCDAPISTNEYEIPLFKPEEIKESVQTPVLSNQSNGDTARTAKPKINLKNEKQTHDTKTRPDTNKSTTNKTMNQQTVKPTTSTAQPNETDTSFISRINFKQNFDPIGPSTSRDVDVKPIVSDEFDDVLNDLLTSSTDVTVTQTHKSTKEPKKPQQVTSSTTNNNEQDLEDWLDSII
ncbi:uncharacterized protein LOC100180984 [Ciona intestinalis]